MKKKILSLILVLMLIPFASFFSACGKDKGYDLTTLDDEFYHIADCNNISLDAGKLVFDYSNQANMNFIINSYEPYVNLNNYNYVYNNLMEFACEYIDECSNNSIENAEIKNKVKADFENFKKSMQDVNECTNMFAEIINVSQGVDVLAPACLLRFENLLETYETLFNSAISFNNSLADLYFNHILQNGNPNVFGTSIEDFDANTVVSKLKSRILYQKSMLSQNYVEMYIGGDLAEKIADDSEDLMLTVFGYADNIENINKTFTEETAAEKANNETNKQNFYDLAVQAQNIQATLNNDKEKFVYACNTISYAESCSNDTATAAELLCMDIIESNNALVLTYNLVLTEMLNIIA